VGEPYTEESSGGDVSAWLYRQGAENTAENVMLTSLYPGNGGEVSKPL
jgi:hypothetical protein